MGDRKGEALPVGAHRPFRPSGPRQHRRTIHAELFTSFFVVVVIGVVLVGTVSYSVSSRSMRSIAEQANEQLASQIKQSLDQDFHRKRDLLLAPYYEAEYLTGIARYPAMSESERYLFQQALGDLYLMNFYVSPRPDFVRFTVYDANGEMMYTSGNKEIERRNVRKEPWFEETVARRGAVYFSGSYETYDESTRAGRQRVYSASMLVRNYPMDHAFIVVRAEYNLRLLEQLGRNAGISENSQIVIYDGRGGIVYRSNPFDHAIDGDLAQVLDGAPRAFWYTSEEGGAMRVSLAKLDFADWTVALVTPQSDIHRGARQIQRATIVTVALAFVVTSLISLILSRRITRPIGEMVRGIQRVKAGDWSVRVPVDRQNELGTIANHFNDMVEHLERLVKTEYLYQLRLKEAELSSLYSQINPHFLYNTLDSMRAMADVHGVAELSDMASALAGMFRYNTQRQEWVRLRDEIGQLEEYLTIQRYRFGESIEAEWKVDDGLWDCRLLRMTLQPLVENAIFHGLEPRRGRGRVRIEAREDRGVLLLSVIDNGVGMSAEQLERVRSIGVEEAAARSRKGGSRGGEGGRSGVGLSNVLARYALRFGSAFSYAVESEVGKGTTITLRIPLRYEG